MDVLESKDDVIVDPGVAGAAFMTSLAALVQASQAGNPLDEQSLRFCVETLDGRITELKEDVFATVKGHWAVFQDSFLCADQLGTKVVSIRQALLKLITALRSQGVDSVQSNAVQLALRHQRLSAELDQHSHFVSLLEVLATVHEGFLAFDKDLAAGRYQAAADGIAQLQRATSRLPRAVSPRQDDAQIVLAVRQQLVRKQARLRARLGQLAAEALIVTGDHVLRVRTELAGTYGHLHFDNRTSLNELLSSLETVDMLDSLFETFASNLMNHVLTPILEDELVPVVDERSSSASQQVLTCVPSADMPAPSPSPVAGGRGPSSPLRSGTPLSRSVKGASPRRAYYAGTAASPSWVEAVLDRLLVVVQFLQANVFEEQPELFARLGRCLWHGRERDGGVATGSHGQGGGTAWSRHGIARQLLDLLHKALPREVVVMREFHPVLEAAEAFEQQLFARRMLTDPEDRVLSAFTKDADAHFAYKKRRHVLAEARRLLTSEYHNSIPVVDSEETGSLGALPISSASGGEAPSTPAPSRRGGKGGSGRSGRSRRGGPSSGGGGGGGGDSDGAMGLVGSDGRPAKVDTMVEPGLYFFRLPSCQVSTSAHALIALAHATMEEAAKSTTPKCATVLYHTARDAVDMFRAVVPCRFSDSLTAVPRLAMLLHNDCMYIAHHLMTIAHQYRHRFPPPLNSTASMLDLASSFRLLGEQSFVAHMRRQRDQLQDFVAGTASFDQLTNHDSFADVEHAVKAQLYHLTQLSGSWGDILPSHIYARSMAHLVDAVLEQFISGVQALADIPEALAHQLHYLLSLLFESERVFAASTVELSSSGDATPAATPAKADDVCRLWSKAQQLATLLDQPLVVLQEKHAAGELFSFTNSEVAAFIRAVFEMTPTSRAFLEALESHA